MRSISSDFACFQSECPLQRVCIPRTEHEWRFYKAGPDRDRDPIVFLHGASGTAGAFFYQVEGLAQKGHRVISAQYPAHDTLEEWCKSFDLFLDHIRCRAVHIFGAGLGGYLAQNFCVAHPQRVRSLMLCNSFCSTHFFAENVGSWANYVHLAPTVLLRKLMLDSFPTGGMELVAKQAIDWMAAQVHELSGDDIACRMTLNCLARHVEQISLEQSRLTIIEVSSETTVPEPLRRELRVRYPDARSALLKATGDFPYLSHPDEATLFVEVHMRRTGVFAAGLPAQMAENSARPGLPGTQSADDAAGGDDQEEDAPARRTRRPVWRNPFEDDPLL